MDDAPALSPPPTMAGVVLCGGRGRRMGTDKALLRVEGERLVDRAARRLAGVADPVILAHGARPLQVQGCRGVGDGHPSGGPLAGIVAGLAGSERRLTAVVAVDMPWFDLELLADMAAAIGNEDAAIPVSPRGLEPLHGVYARSALSPLTAALAAGRLRVTDALAGLRIRSVDAAALIGDERAARFATNLNRPDDLVSLFAQSREGA